MTEAINDAIVYKRAGRLRSDMGRKGAFQRPFKEGVELYIVVQGVYLKKNHNKLNIVRECSIRK